MTRTGTNSPSQMSTADLAHSKSHLTCELARLREQLFTARADTATDLKSSPAGGDTDR